ncbi:hypothetical protein Btru_064495 [Bulinus truncatus]|nr:hypothetical protein Btru_064495 [Bulinus truncatus]
MIQWIGWCWLIAAFMQTEKFYDLAGSSTFVILTLLSLSQNRILHRQQKINCGLVFMWALRLGVYLVTRVLKDGGDKCFNIVKHKPALFWVYWTIQGVWVLSTLLPTILVNSKKDNKPINLLDYAG